MGKGSRFAFQTGILLFCAWVCEPIITLEAEVVPGKGGGAAPQASARRVATSAAATVPTARLVPTLDVSLLSKTWPGLRNGFTSGPVDPFTYRHFPRQTPWAAAVDVLRTRIGHTGLDFPKAAATDPVTRQYLGAPVNHLPGGTDHQGPSRFPAVVVGAGEGFASGGERAAFD